MTHVDVFVGSHCQGNPGDGSWAAVLRVGRHEKVLSGTEPSTTANRLDLQALIEALRILVEPCTVAVHSPGRVLADGFARWSAHWTARGWSASGPRPVNNADHWSTLITLARTHALTFAAVSADDSPAMARALQLARDAASAQTA